MSGPYLSIGRLERRLSTGHTEELQFSPGVNVLVGRPNTGKTKWLQTLDYLLGDAGENPFEGLRAEGLAEKYDAAGVELIVGEERLWIERRWREPGSKAKVFVSGEGVSPHVFQELLMQKLGIPLVRFPKGNPMSGQTWPELSFRMLLRHIYRQQRFWGGIADQQPDGEQHACLMQFVGLAERLFTAEYGQLVALRMEVERLKSRRDQYGQTLDELVGEVVSEPGLSVGANPMTVRAAGDRVARELDVLRERRMTSIANARNQVVPAEHRGRVQRLGEERVASLAAIGEMRRKATDTTERLDKMRVYKAELEDEIDRITRAADAGAILGDLKITHCPACDRPVVDTSNDGANCFLCHQAPLQEPALEGLGSVRLQFERDRLAGELKEAEQLIGVLQREAKRIAKDIGSAEEQLRMLENELAPAREAVAALVQEEVSAIDMALGELSERQRQLGRIYAALGVGQQLTDRIAAIEQEIEPLQARVDEVVRSTDFGAAAAKLEDGMNAYLAAISALRPGVWQHSSVTVDFSRSNVTMRVGSRRWQAALGGTDSLYFLMAYHYGLVGLSGRSGCHYPGFSVIDVPGEFSGEAVEDKENFIVQPFIDLLAQEEYRGAQVIITGVTFSGLEAGHRVQLVDVYVT